MKIELKSIKHLFILLAVIIAVLGYAIFMTSKYIKETRVTKQQREELANLRTIASTEPTINLTETIRDTIEIPGQPYPIVRVEYKDGLRRDLTAMKKIAVSDSTINTLIAALDLKSRQVEQITNLYSTTRAENLQLRRNVITKTINYEDKYITLDIDSNDVVKQLRIKNDIALTEYWKKKNMFSPREYYTSVTTQSPYLTIDSVSKVGRKQRETFASLYLDNRYYNTTKFNNGFITSTLNAEINNSGTFSWIIGAGIKSDLKFVETIVVGGVKINLWRIKK